jgi:hypothetical protein
MYGSIRAQWRGGINKTEKDTGDELKKKKKQEDASKNVGPSNFMRKRFFKESA